MTSTITDRQVAPDISDLVEVGADACLAVLTSPEDRPGEHAAARQRLRQIRRWFDGSPQEVAALIDALAEMDPLRRARRKAALVDAWAGLPGATP